jgi:NTE family protein
MARGSEQMDTEQTRVSLVLGSGGARGHAHIGVIRAIEERGLRIHNIAGTSMGALIGGIYAAGELDTYTEWVNRLERRDVIKLLDLSFTWKSIFKGERIFAVLEELIGDRRIEDLDRGFVAVATALEAQREIWLNSGGLFRAMRASCAVPGVFSPVEIDGVSLVDGGLVNPIPIAPTLNDSTDFTIAVNLNAINTRQLGGDQLEPDTSPQDQVQRSKLAQFIEKMMPGDDQEEKKAEANASDLLIRSIDVMQGAIARMKLATYVPDKVVEIPRDACTFFEFDRAEELADLGYKVACSAIDELIRR